MKLRPKIAVSLMVCSLIPLALITIVALQHSIKQTQIMAVQLAFEQLNHEAVELSSFVSEHLREVSAYSNAPIIRRMDPAASIAFLKQEIALPSSVYEKLIIANTEGHFYNTAGGNPHHDGLRTFDDTSPTAKPRHIRKRDYWQVTVGNNTDNRKVSYVSNPMISYTTGSKQVVLSSSIIGPDGLLKGMIGGAIPWQVFESRMQAIKKKLSEQLNGPIQLMLISNNGEYWYHWQASKNVRLKAFSNYTNNRDEQGEKIAIKYSIFDEPQAELVDIGRHLKNQQSGHSSYIHHKTGERLFAIYAPVSGGHFGLIATLPESQVLQPVSELKQRFIPITILAVGLLILTSLLLTRLISQPILALQKNAQAIIDKETDQIIVPNSHDETEALARSFKELVDDLFDSNNNLQLAEERTQLIMENINDGVWDIDLFTGQVSFSAKLVTDQLGYAEGEITDLNWQSLSDRLHPDDRSPALDAIANFIKEGAHGIYEIEYRVQHHDGRWLTILNRGCAVHDHETGRAIRLIGTQIDISERKRAEQEIRSLNNELEKRVKERTAALEATNLNLNREIAERIMVEEKLQHKNYEAMQASRAKSAFLASVSHELRTPLNAILGFCHRLPKVFTGELNEKQTRTLDAIQDSSKNLDQLVSNVLEMTKIEAGQLELAIELVDFANLCTQVTEEYRQACDKKNLQLSITATEDKLCCNADPQRLKQVLRTLLNNAINYTHSGSIEILISAAERPNIGPVINLSVSDTGTGIKPEDLDKLFTRFERLGQHQISGAGLGLVIAEAIMKAHQGSIEVHSEYDAGSTFSLIFPRLI